MRGRTLYPHAPRRSLPVLACLFTLPLLTPAQDKKKDPDQIGNRDVDKGINLYSIPKEMALGKALATEVIRNNHVVDDPVIAEYVNRLGQNLARNSDAKIPVTMNVIQGETINAHDASGRVYFREHGTHSGGRYGI